MDGMNAERIVEDTKKEVNLFLQVCGRNRDSFIFYFQYSGTTSHLERRYGTIGTCLCYWATLNILVTYAPAQFRSWL